MSKRRRISGVVRSDKMDKTVVVEISRKFSHPLYKKVVSKNKRVKAHDELGSREGDEVLLVESRPLSREKRWVVESILKQSQKSAEQGEKS